GKEKELTVACAKTQNLPNDGTVVTIHKPVKRIIHLIPSELEAIRAIGAKDKVVGVCSFVSTEDEIFLPELIKLPCVGIFSSPDHEKILELKPDIVFTFPGWNPEFEDKLPGITVVRLSKFSDKMLEVKKLGYILDKKDEAEEFLDWCEGYINKIKSRTERHSEDEKPRVYLSWGTAGEGVSGKNTELDKPCTIAGGINIAGDFEGSFKIDPEWVIEQNPDIIYNSHWYISSGYAEDDPAEMKKYRGNIMSNPGWENIKAVKRGRVHIMTWKISVGHGPLMTAYMARWFHPDLFEDLDPEAIHQEYLTRFQGLDYDLDEHGVFVYPPIEIDGGLAGIPERYNGQI
ncbi:MAG: ABC transporter substrate-binding protein, partial [Methanophagales archaeon]|nr:ABC transporter substrate-binding protein [Methanophagales archaeon]